jgi:hypothetical protein
MCLIPGKRDVDHVAAIDTTWFSVDDKFRLMRSVFSEMMPGTRRLLGDTQDMRFG